MKLKNLLCGIAVAFSLLWVGCDKEDLSGVPPMIEQSFRSEYPDAKIYDCDFEPGGYWVVESKINGKEADVWFDEKGNWVMTEYDIRFNSLPREVQNSFKSSEYGKFKVEDVEMIERYDLNNASVKDYTYIIEVETYGDVDVKLHYTADGVLVREETEHDGNGPYIPQTTVPKEISSFIESTYPNARIIEMEIERDGTYEVEIVDRGVAKEVLFAPDMQWISTSYDVLYASLPKAVTDYVSMTYPGYVCDDAEFYETAKGSYYELELEARGVPDIDLRINPDGSSPVVLPNR